MVKRNLSGQVLDQILNTPVQVVEDIHLAGYKYRHLTNLVAQNQAIINFKNT